MKPARMSLSMSRSLRARTRARVRVTLSIPPENSFTPGPRLFIPRPLGFSPMGASDQAPKKQELTLANLQANPNADPIRQLLYATLHSRRALDRIDRTIKQDLKRAPGMPDPLFFTPIGQALHEYQHQVREQLARLAKAYIALGIEERQTRVVEDWSNILLPFITALMDDPDLALSRAQRERIPGVVERHLRVLERSNE